MASTIISHRAALPEDGRIYVPECIRQLLPSTLCAVVEQRDELGKCIAFYLKMHTGSKGQDVAVSDGYLCIGQLCAEAGIEMPWIWRASTTAKGRLEELLLHHDYRSDSYSRQSEALKSPFRTSAHDFRKI